VSWIRLMEILLCCSGSLNHLCKIFQYPKFVNFLEGIRASGRFPPFPLASPSQAIPPRVKRGAADVQARYGNPRSRSSFRVDQEKP